VLSCLFWSSKQWNSNSLASHRLVSNPELNYFLRERLRFKLYQIFLLLLSQGRECQHREVEEGPTDWKRRILQKILTLIDFIGPIRALITPSISKHVWNASKDGNVPILFPECEVVAIASVQRFSRRLPQGAVTSYRPCSTVQESKVERVLQIIEDFFEL